MEKPILWTKTFSKSLTVGTINLDQYRFMLYDKFHTCKTYDAGFYTWGYFLKTRCPGCGAVGRFNLHGSYFRNVIFFKDFKIICDRIEVKRVMCKSCNATHAVLPGDIIAYELLSLLVFLYVLVSFHVEKVSVLKLANRLQFSHQFIYATLHSFIIFMNNIHQFFRETYPAAVPLALNPSSLLGLIRTYNPCTEFQYQYIESNKRPCFMCKFFSGGKSPPVGIIVKY